ncbi:hypothetical protein CPB86DRAFT_785264 [Serendipita vermifera]|nr:hypothetical protein CPB86DRAFT_785264 [Serendipita vermifera]
MTTVQSHTWTTLNLFSQFSTVSHPHHGYQHQPRPQTPAMNTTNTATTSSAYTAPAVISLGEEYTDATLPEHSSYLSLEEENGEEEEGGFMDYDDDACSTTSSEESSPISPSSSRRNSARRSIVPALWHAEHARLLNIQSVVLEKERRVRSRELKLESEVARIKTDLARLKQARTEQAQAARLSWLAANPQATATTSSNTTSDSAITSPTANKRTSSGSQSVNSTTASATVTRVMGPRGPRPKPQPQSTSSNTRSDATPQASLAIKFEQEETVAPVEKARPESQLLPLSMSFEPTAPTLGKFAFESAPLEEDPVLTESLLATHLTEARSARAQERHKRKIEHERIRELSMLLTLGSEVRKWEERLAWNQRSRGTCSDDMSIIESGGQKEREDAMDTDPDPRFKRLSRSFSLPSRGSFVGPSPSTSSDKKAPLPLPSLSDSPLWRVSAEMILRRGSRSERPRRPPVAPPAATVPSTSAVAPSAAPSSSSTTLTRPSHVLRGPREQRSTGSASTSPSSTSPASTTVSPSAISPSSPDGSSSVVPSGATSSGKRYSVPPPIQIPSNSQFCNPTTTMAGVLPATAGATVAGQTEAAGEAEALRGFGERPAHPQSAQFYSGNNGSFHSRSTTPIKPSTLKWAFTADDLAKELELEKMQNKKDGDVEMDSPTTPTSGESESDDSYRSSSEGGVSSSSQPAAAAAPPPAERRGRARFSWRRSLPKDTNHTKEEIPAVPPVHIGA